MVYVIQNLKIIFIFIQDFVNIYLKINLIKIYIHTKHVIQIMYLHKNVIQLYIPKKQCNTSLLYVSNNLKQ